MDHSDKTAKGNVLLTESTTVQMQEGTHFIISNGFESMTVAASTVEEAKEWVNAIEATVQDEVCKSVRGYLEIQVAQLMGKKFQKKWKQGVALKMSLPEISAEIKPSPEIKGNKRVMSKPVRANIIVQK